jgi:hypothetical protein
MFPKYSKLFSFFQRSTQKIITPQKLAQAMVCKAVLRGLRSKIAVIMLGNMPIINSGKEAGENITKDKIIAQLIPKWELFFLAEF